MKRILTAIWRTLAQIGVSPRLAGAIQAGVIAAGPYLSDAYELAKIAAAMTPTRSDDEILALADRLGVPALFDSAIDDKGLAISRIVYRALKMKFPHATDRAINRAIELAYGAIKP